MTDSPHSALVFDASCLMPPAQVASAGCCIGRRSSPRCRSVLSPWPVALTVNRSVMSRSLFDLLEDVGIGLLLPFG